MGPGLRRGDGERCKFSTTGKSAKPVKPRNQKYSAFQYRRFVRSSGRLAPTRGTFRDRHERWARDAMDAVASGAFFAPDESAAAYGEVVWSWRRDPGVKPMERSKRRRWQERPLTGESTKETVKPLRGESRRRSAEPVVTMLVRVLCLRTRLRVHPAPVFPCALHSTRDNELATPGRKRAAGMPLVVLKNESES